MSSFIGTGDHLATFFLVWKWIKLCFLGDFIFQQGFISFPDENYRSSRYCWESRLYPPSLFILEGNHRQRCEEISNRSPRVRMKKVVNSEEVKRRNSWRNQISKSLSGACWEIQRGPVGAKESKEEELVGKSGSLFLFYSSPWVGNFQKKLILRHPQVSNSDKHPWGVFSFSFSFFATKWELKAPLLRHFVTHTNRILKLIADIIQLHNTIVQKNNKITKQVSEVSDWLFFFKVCSLLNHFFVWGELKPNKVSSGKRKSIWTNQLLISMWVNFAIELCSAFKLRNHWFSSLERGVIKAFSASSLVEISWEISEKKLPHHTFEPPKTCADLDCERVVLCWRCC